MRFLTLFLGLVVFLLAVGFAVKNSEIVTVHYYLGYAWQAPLVVVLLVAFALGAAAGVAATLGLLVRQRRRIVKLERRLRAKAEAKTSAQPGSE